MFAMVLMSVLAEPCTLTVRCPNQASEKIEFVLSCVKKGFERKYQPFDWTFKDKFCQGESLKVAFKGIKGDYFTCKLQREKSSPNQEKIWVYDMKFSSLEFYVQEIDPNDEENEDVDGTFAGDEVNFTFNEDLAETETIKQGCQQALAILDHRLNV